MTAPLLALAACGLAAAGVIAVACRPVAQFAARHAAGTGAAR